MQFRFFYLFILLPTAFYAQTLKLEKIMKGNDFIGHSPSNHRWSFDGNSVYFNWKTLEDKESTTYYWNSNTRLPMRFEKEKSALFYLNPSYQKEFETVYYNQNGTLHAYNRNTKKNKKIWVTSQSISEIFRSTNPNIIYIISQKNVYQYDALKGSMLQITNFKSGSEKQETATESPSFLEKQQEELFLYVKENNNTNLTRDKEQKSELPKPYFYGKYQMEEIKPSFDGKFVTFRLSEYPSLKRTNVEQYITASGYTESQNARAKVSISNLSKHKMGIYSIEKDSVYFVSFSKLTHGSSFPAYYNEYELLKDKEAQDKEIVMLAPIYSTDGKRTVFEIRSQDNKDRWIVALDLQSGMITELNHQHDEAWIGGPGIPNYCFTSGTLEFIDNKTLYFQSEITGYSHLYTYNFETKETKPLTSGEWEVHHVNLSNDKKSMYIIANKTHPGNRDFYKLDLVNQKLIPILTKDGAHEVEISPDEKKLLIRYSYKTKPWELFIAENKPNATMKAITHSTLPEFETYKWYDPKVITFNAKDGTQVYARLYEPKEAQKNKAAVIFVHGAGYLQNAHQYWSSYYREYMFHNLLIEKGFTVLDIDYRASEGYGRATRTGIYRHMGGLDLEDQLDGKNYLVTHCGIDAERVGIYGGSYGGFITLMALLTKPNAFKAGAALRSVTDWAHYNQGYTSNILNFPETDELAYRRSSPIYFADNLKDKLLMLHGMVDDNVQFQDVVRLAQRFIELGKKNWDLAIYPVEAHGFKETYSWVDEYQRILNLFEEQLADK